ncbi:transporter substrate-binding domain-containing protein [Deltaproteobacteria bacterium TL4]
MGADLWCPYACEGGKNFNGFSVEVTQEALRLKGWKTEYINASFDRVTLQVETGHWQIAIATDSVFTPSLLITKEPVAYTKWVFVVRKDENWKFEGVASLRKKILGGVKGYVYSPAVMDYLEQHKNSDRIFLIASVTPQKQGLSMLVENRIDVYLEDEIVIRYWAKQLKILDKIEVVGIDSEIPLYNGLKTHDENAAQLAELIDSGIRELKNTETLKRLLTKYDISIWK